MTSWNHGNRPPAPGGSGAGGNRHSSNFDSPWRRGSNFLGSAGPCPYIDMKVGNHLRSTYPAPIRSDQVILVPSMFGSDLNMTTFIDLRGELERMLQDKFRQKDWSLDRVRKASVLASTVYNLSVPLSRTTPAQEGTSATGTDDDSGIQDASSSSPAIEVAARGAGADPAVASSSPPSLSKYVATARAAHTICRYFSIDPDTAHVSLGIQCGTSPMRAREAHSGHNWNCFVVATFGDPRVAVFRQRDGGRPPHQPYLRAASCFHVPLANNAVMAIMPNVTDQGWVYSIDGCPDDLDEEEGCVIDGVHKEQRRLETVTLLISGNCTKMRRRDNPAARIAVPHGWGQEDRRSPFVLRRSSWASPDGGHHRSAIVSDASSKDSYDDELSGASTGPSNAAGRHDEPQQRQHRRSSTSPLATAFDAHEHDEWQGQHAHADNYHHDRHGDPFFCNQDRQYHSLQHYHDRPFREAWDEQQQQRRVRDGWDGGGCRHAIGTDSSDLTHPMSASSSGSRSRPAPTTHSDEIPGVPSKRMRGITPEESCTA